MPSRPVLLQGLSKERLERRRAQENLQVSQRGCSVGDGAMQVQNPEHEGFATKREESFKTTERSFTDNIRQFFKLFTQSTFEGSKAAARKMKKIINRQTNTTRNFCYFTVYTFLFTPTRRSFYGPTVHFSCCFSSSIPTCCRETNTKHCKKGRPEALCSTS
jgi:hypothetical protein